MALREKVAGEGRAGEPAWGAADVAPVAYFERAPLPPVRAPSPFPEIDCIRNRLSPAAIAWAEQRAAALQVGADEVLVTTGYISEEVYSRAFAFALGLRFAELASTPRELCPLTDETLLLAAQAGFLPVVDGNELRWIIAARGMRARRLIGAVRANPELRRFVRITTPENIARFVCRRGGAALEHHAAERLRTSYPIYSAGVRSWRLLGVLGLAALTVVAAFTAAPAAATAIAQLLVSFVFLAWTGLRLVAAASSHQRTGPELPSEDAPLPVYTIIVALRGEQAAVTGLISALRSLDYPPEKIDLILALEPDDLRTRAAVEAVPPSPPFRIVFAPAVEPRTKPKALNAALPFARGEYVVVYDAEDRPEPDQLRCALAAFRADTTKALACVQARLAIDNVEKGWLPAWFAAEYAGLFDVLLPGLAKLNLPIPLGGSSNHFDLRILRRVAAWDPYNVTEDADLGTRLARRGYRTGVIASTTGEEAPANVASWLKQRTRWFKGWLQTWRVHMRRPFVLLRELGPAGFATFQLMIFGSVLAALLQPIALGLIVCAHALDWQPSRGSWLDIPGLDWLHLFALASGYAASLALVLLGLARRKRYWIMWLAPFVIVHWILLSIAAWRALFQLWRNPYGWEKTEHVLERQPVAATT